jgi:hypothetical protein
MRTGDSSSDKIRGISDIKWDKRSTKIVKQLISINFTFKLQYEKHLYEKDNFTDKAPAPIGPYNQAVLKGNTYASPNCLNPLRRVSIRHD